MKKLSVIIPIYRMLHSDFNELKSFLFNQNIGFENIEVIFVLNKVNNDFLCEDFLNFVKSEENIRLFALEKCYSVQYAYNIGLKNSTTDYVIFFDMDCKLHKNAFKILYDEISNNNADVVIGDCESSINSKNLGKIKKRQVIENDDFNPNVFSIDFILSSRIYNKNFILKNYSFELFQSWSQFNFLTLFNANKIILINDAISVSNPVKENNELLINFDKIRIFDKIKNKQYSDLTIAIKSPNPTNEKHWGDLFFASSLKKSFQKKGFNVVIHEREYWESLEDDVDIVIVLRGLIEYNPKPENVNIMWNISHPDDVSLEEYEKYDFVFIASEKYANTINNEVNTIVKPLFQCTDPEIFYPLENKNYEEDVLFVGITRGVFRDIIKDISKTDNDYSVYGYGWDRFIDSKHIKGDFIPNKILNQAYSSCKILLNDHWEDMKIKDFPSNRLFDALACGAFIISDNINSANTLFEGNIITYDDSDDLDKKIKYYLTHDGERELISERGRELVLKRHTFDNRVDEIIDSLTNFDFNDFIKPTRVSVSNFDENDNESIIRIIILDYNDSKYISESLNNIKSISDNIPVSVLNLSNFSSNKFLFSHSNFDLKNQITDEINNLVSTINEDFVMIINSGDILNEKTMHDFLENYQSQDNDNIGAIIYDDISNPGNKTNFKLGFSPDLYLEHDYLNNAIILNRKAVFSNGLFDKNLHNNFIRDIVLKLHDEHYEIIKHDQILLNIKNKINKVFHDENKMLLDKHLNNQDYEILNVNKNNSLIPLYDTQGLKASIIIPFKDQAPTTKICVDSILEKTLYTNYEIILIDNNSYDEETFEYLDEVRKNNKCSVFRYENSFNWSKINNFGSSKATGDVLIFLNNDTEVISPEWLSLLIGDVIQPGVGAVGPKLLYPDDTIQHAGVVVGLTYFAGHIFANENENKIPYVYNFHRRNVSAVTGACMAFNKEVFEKIGKFDENFEISFSDIEICLRAIEKGYRNIYNPISKLYHHEMKSRGTGDFRDIDRLLAFDSFKNYLKIGDPFFNKNYSLNYHHLVPKRENEVPKFKQFWERFINDHDAHFKSVVNARNDIDINPEFYFMSNKVFKSDLINNSIFMRNSLKNSHDMNFKDIIWFMPDLTNSSPDFIYPIYRFAELLSIFENTHNYFIFENHIEKENILKIKNEYSSLNFDIIHLDDLKKLDNNKADIAFCTDLNSAYNLLKFNNCYSKFYFLQNQSYSLSDNFLKNNLINQSYKLGFVGITNSKSIYSTYKKYNPLVEYFHPSINEEFYFPFESEKFDKMTIVFNANLENEEEGFFLGIEVLRVLRAYFEDKIDIYVVGSDCNLEDYGLFGVHNLGSDYSEIELANIYRRAHICLMFSFNSSTIRFLKCMACGCALITNFNENNEWLVKYKENAYLTQPILECVVEDVIDLINNDKVRNRIITNALKTVKKYDEKQEFLRIINFIKNIY